MTNQPRKKRNLSPQIYGAGISPINQYGLGDNIVGDKVMGDKIGNQYINSPNLAEVAREIQGHLEHLEANNPQATEEDQINYVNAIIPVNRRQKALNALKAGWEETIKQFVKNPYAKVAIAILKGWGQGKSS
jgi:hypothetical protein